MNKKYEKILPFLEENKDLIETNNFDELYAKLKYVEDISLFSQLLLEAGINPLLHLNEVPDHFLCESDIVDFEIPSTIQVIDTFAFSFCINLRSITMHNSVKSIKSLAFEYCKDLEKIVFSDNITEIGYKSFTNCWKLDNLVLPEKLKNIDSEAFYQCRNLHEITLHQGPMRVSLSAFDKCPLNSIIYKGTSKQWLENVRFYPNIKLIIHCLDKDIRI